MIRTALSGVGDWYCLEQRIVWLYYNLAVLNLLIAGNRCTKMMLMRPESLQIYFRLIEYAHIIGQDDDLCHGTICAIERDDRRAFSLLAHELVTEQRIGASDYGVNLGLCLNKMSKISVVLLIMA